MCIRNCQIDHNINVTGSQQAFYTLGTHTKFSSARLCGTAVDIGNCHKI